MRASLSIYLVPCLLLALTGQASAQEPVTPGDAPVTCPSRRDRRAVAAPEAPRPVSSVVLRGDADSEEIIVRCITGKRDVVARCFGECRLELPAGNYRIAVPPGVGYGSKVVSVDASTPGWQIESANAFAKYGGIVLGAGGLGLMLAGGVVYLLPDLMGGLSHGPGESAADTKARERLALKLVLIGTVPTAVGWTLAYLNWSMTLHPLGESSVALNAGAHNGVWGLAGQF
jgi:hypothetical protein